MDNRYDRSAEDIGNIVGLEHVNVQVADQPTATLFYVAGLGLTRDPYMMAGVDNMWVNVGESQFHLPTGKPQVLRGVTGLVIPNREALLARLAAVRKPLEGTRFSFAEHADFVETVCPWGNRLRCHEPSPAFGAMRLGMAYVEFEVPKGAAAGIARFYRDIMGAPAIVEGGAARITAGANQRLIFRETEAEPAAYDKHHIQVYVADFSGPHRGLLERSLVTEESNPYQYRFEDIVDPEGGPPLFVIEHEVRSVSHPLYRRPLVNRNPEQTIRAYQPGRDTFW